MAAAALGGGVEIPAQQNEVERLDIEAQQKIESLALMQALMIIWLNPLKWTNYMLV